MRVRSTFHEDFAPHEAVQGASDRAFGLTIAIALAVVALWPLLRQRPLRTWALAVAVLFLVPALVRPRALAPLNRAWLRLGLLLQRLVTPVVMALVFFGTVTPIGLVLRWLGKDLLRLSIDRGAGSYWLQRRPPGPAPDTMRNQF